MGFASARQDEGTELTPDVLERLSEAGVVALMPVRWLVHERQTHSGRAHGFIALKPLKLHARRVQAGDILAAEDESPALERMLASGEIAELPLDRGVLALVLAFQSRIERIEGELAEARLRDHGGRRRRRPGGGGESAR